MGLCDDFGDKFYAAVVKAASKNKLVSVDSIKSRIKARDLRFSQKEVKVAKEKYIKALTKLNNLKKY